MVRIQKYARPRKRVIDQQAVASFLYSLGFETETITQEWRHLTAFGRYRGQSAVFKLASTLRTNPYTRNEWRWNEAVGQIPEAKRPHLAVPRNLDAGEFEKKFYLITTRFPGNHLVKPKQSLPESVHNLLPKVAAATRELELLPLATDTIFARQGLIPHTKAGPEILESATKWASYVPIDLDPFLKIIDLAKNSIRTCPIHGDFVLRHMFVVHQKIGLIDGEHARQYGPNHFDVAQCYIRIRNDHAAPRAAQEYLHYFFKLLSTVDQQSFWQELKPLLIQRYIGDLWGAAKNPRRLAELAQLGNEILHDTVLD